jgi:hypothetical protein
MMNWRWDGGVERKAKLLLRECWTFLIYIFLHQQWKQCLEFMLAKLREICKCLAGAWNSNSHARGLHYLTFVCKTRQGNQRNEASRLRKCIKRAQRYQFALNAKKSLCKLNSLHCRQKNHNLIVKTGTKRELEKKEMRPQANNAQYNTQGEGGWGWSEKTVGGGRAAPLHKLLYEPGEIVWQCT